MSSANVTYLLQHNPDLDPAKVEVNPNSIEINAADAASPDKSLLRLKFGLPEDKTLFIYGGNPGKPQGLDFLLKVIENTQDLEKVFFLIIGSVTEYPKLKRWFNQNKPKNALLFESAPKADFDLLVQSCDVGMIFLDGRFTIPNFPSRLLTYLECSKPVISATDKNTDIGTIMEENGFGLWCESGDTQRFMATMKTLMADPEKAKAMGKNGRAFLEKNYLVSDAYQTIMKHFENV